MRFIWLAFVLLFNTLTTPEVEASIHTYTPRSLHVDGGIYALVRVSVYHKSLTPTFCSSFQFISSIVCPQSSASIRRRFCLRYEIYHLNYEHFSLFYSVSDKDGSAISLRQTFYYKFPPNDSNLLTISFWCYIAEI